MIKGLLLDIAHPHVVFTPYPHRSLKTKASERISPVVGASLWAAERLSANTNSAFCFPRIQTNSDATATQQVLPLTSGLKPLLAMR